MSTRTSRPLLRRGSKPIDQNQTHTNDVNRENGLHSDETSDDSSVNRSKMRRKKKRKAAAKPSLIWIQHLNVLIIGAVTALASWSIYRYSKRTIIRRRQHRLYMNELKRIVEEKERYQVLSQHLMNTPRNYANNKKQTNEFLQDDRGYDDEGVNGDDGVNDDDGVNGDDGGSIFPKSIVSAFFGSSSTPRKQRAKKRLDSHTTLDDDSTLPTTRKMGPSMTTMVERLFGSERCPNHRDDVCVIRFAADTRMALCYYYDVELLDPSSSSSFGQIGPDIVERIVRNQYPGCRIDESNILVLPLNVSRSETVRRNANVNCLFAGGIGFLQFFQSGDHVWGTGISALPSETKISHHLSSTTPNVLVHSARGPRTIQLLREQLQVQQKDRTNQTTHAWMGLDFVTRTKESDLILSSSHAPYGDPIFLVPFLYPQYTKQSKQQRAETTKNRRIKLSQLDETNTKHEHFEHDLLLPDTFCFVMGTGGSGILKAQEQRVYNFYKGDHDVVIIPSSTTWEHIVSKLRTCDYVSSSSSLQSLIVADAMGIPIQWIQHKTIQGPGNNMKARQDDHSLQHMSFLDYFESIRRGPENFMQHQQGFVPDYTKIKDKTAYAKPLTMLQRDHYAQQILASFPYDMFESECAPKTTNTTDHVQSELQEELANIKRSSHILHGTQVERDTIIQEQEPESYEKVNRKNAISADKMCPKNQRCSVNFKDAKRMALCYFLPYGKNFGDELGPAMTRRLLENKFPGCQLDHVVANLRTERKLKHGRNCLFTLGSILHMVRSGDHIWGTGANPFWLKQIYPNITVHATRGPRTWKLFQKHQPTSTIGLDRKVPNYGDPGYLTPTLYTQYQKTITNTGNSGTDSSSFKFCLIPHFHDLGLSEVKAYVSDPSITILSPHNTWEDVVGNISSNCDFVASSSLHGLIVADAMGLPTQWIQLPSSKTAQTEGYFKYLDFYDSTLRFNMKPLEVLTQVKNLSAYVDALPSKKRADYSDAMIRSFPFHLFQSTCQ